MSPATLGGTLLKEFRLACENDDYANMLSLLDQHVLLMLRVGEHEHETFDIVELLVRRDGVKTFSRGEKIEIRNFISPENGGRLNQYV